MKRTYNQSHLSHHSFQILLFQLVFVFFFSLIFLCLFLLTSPPHSYLLYSDRVSWMLAFSYLIPLFHLDFMISASPSILCEKVYQELLFLHSYFVLIVIGKTKSPFVANMLPYFFPLQKGLGGAQSFLNILWQQLNLLTAFSDEHTSVAAHEGLWPCAFTTCELSLSSFFFFLQMRKPVAVQMAAAS